MREVKIAHIITDLDIGGAEMMLLKLLRHFKDEDYSHFVVSLKPAGSVGRMLEREGFRVYSLGLNRINGLRSFLTLLSILQRERPRIVHTYLFHADLFGRVASKVVGIPVVVSSLRSVHVGGRMREILLRITDFCVDTVTAVSRSVADIHVAKGTTTPRKLRVIYNGVECGTEGETERLSVRRDFGIDDDSSLLTTIGRLEAVKGHTYLLAALKILKEKGCRCKLLIVGKGGRENVLRDEIKRHSLDGDVLLLGEKEEIRGLLAATDVFVLSSLWEGMPNALLEAMARGLAVVATRVGGIVEVVKDGENGMLVNTKDSDALSKALERVIVDDEFRCRLGRNAREYVEENFNILTTVAQTRSLYRELLKHNAKD